MDVNGGGCQRWQPPTGWAVNCPPALTFKARRRSLKQIIAVVKPYLVERLLEGLKRAPLEACSVQEVKGYGRQKSYLDEYSDGEYSMAFLPKVEVTLWVDDARVEEIVRKVIEITRTGRMGDGKIFVMPAVKVEREIDIGGKTTK